LQKAYLTYVHVVGIKKRFGR